MKLKKKQVYPSKTTLNLVINELPPHYYRNLLIAAVIGALLIAAFSKFAVADRLLAAGAEWRVTDGIRAQVNMLKNTNAKYDEVRAEYDLYFANNTAQDTVVDCMEVLRIIDERLLSKAHVKSADLDNNMLSVILGGIDLDEATGILMSLYEHEELVASVEISTASSPGDAETSVAMTIGLNPRGGIN